jgi:hypothetical protein
MTANVKVRQMPNPDTLNPGLTPEAAMVPPERIWQSPAGQGPLRTPCNEFFGFCGFDKMLKDDFS